MVHNSRYSSNRLSFGTGAEPAAAGMSTGKVICSKSLSGEVPFRDIEVGGRGDQKAINSHLHLMALDFAPAPAMLDGSERVFSRAECAIPSRQSNSGAVFPQAFISLKFCCQGDVIDRPW
jgi:hypothetical protein